MVKMESEKILSGLFGVFGLQTADCRLQECRRGSQKRDQARSDKFESAKQHFWVHDLLNLGMLYHVAIIITIIH